MSKERLDIALVKRGLTSSRSQAENWIHLGKVTINGQTATKSGCFVDNNADIKLVADEQYVSRAGLKLASVAKILKIDFRDKLVLDVGSSTGGFTDYALRHGARKVYAVDVGTNQLHSSLRGNERIELHEKTDIRSVFAAQRPVLDERTPFTKVEEIPDLVVIDVSFISLRDILPHIHDNLSGPDTQIIAMVKPQFEAGRGQTNKGIIKNESVRRQILHDFEDWTRNYFVIESKRDSEVAGAKGNRERFYALNNKLN